MEELGPGDRVSLRARTVPIASVTPAQRTRLWTLFSEAYEDVNEAVFLADFASKDHVILLDDGELQGFSTLREVEVDLDGRVHLGMFSGDTVVAQQYWGDRTLGRAFLSHLFWRRLRALHRPYWWILISKGYKTYLMMANNFPVHWPRLESATPPEVLPVMSEFGGALFGASYHADSGIVRWDEPHGRLRPGVADITPGLAETVPRVGFFEAQNPGWSRGDELFCLARMDMSAPFAYAAKFWRGARR